MSSHPGSTLGDAVALAECLKRDRYAPEQVQDYYPTPGTASTVMFYTGIDPLSGKSVFVPRDYHEKQLQRALLQFNRPQNAATVREALKKAHREDLIGTAPHCLVRPEGRGYPPTGAENRDKRGGDNRTKRAERPRAQKGRAPVAAKGQAPKKPSGKNAPRSRAKGKR